MNQTFGWLCYYANLPFNLDNSFSTREAFSWS